MELLTKQVEQRLDLSELIELFKLEKQNEAKPIKLVTAEQRMNDSLEAYNSICYMLAENKPSELRAIRELTTYDFLKLIEIKRNEK